ncbi:MAG: hypothetical protein ACRDE8_14535 [Ginsengibacter sp.]
MKNLLLIVVVQIISLTTFAQVKFFPSKTPVIPVKDTLHGVIFADYYRWLEDKEDTKVIEDLWLLIA